ncbi:YrhK family protein [Williamsia maris]|uniref:YrhK-like protein n=1 Tax=Williamsia maris TaxID=72806 RepID=A0ABT1HD32_9NOCA|nr:YrhK family protein [Williamsia maris]MCP2176089.1 YrhK-like protein [Williamsia maris]
MTGSAGGDSPLTVRIGHDELVIRQRWEVVSIVNDILIAIWFIAGSVLFFGESTTTAGTWLFLVGSIELLIRPMIRLARRVHLQRLNPSSAPSEGDEF